jgi:transcription termination factor Rho
MTEFFSEKPSEALPKRPVKRTRRASASARDTDGTAENVSAQATGAAKEPLKAQEEFALEEGSPKRVRRKKTQTAREESPSVSVVAEEPSASPSREEAAPAPAAAGTRRRKKAAATESSLAEETARPQDVTIDLEGAVKPRRTRAKKEAPQSAAAVEAPVPANREGREAGEEWRPRPRDVSPSAGGAGDSGSGEGATATEAGRKAYPVYVPLHVAKQMEQEGKTAPLAVDAHARQAAAIRAAAIESRRGPEGEAGGAPAASEGAVQGRPERGERADRHDRHDRHGRRKGRHDRHERHDRGERPPREQRDERPDRFRGKREEGEGFDQELPPPKPEELEFGEGVIEVSGKGFGFLRDPRRNYVQSPSDIFVSPEMVRRYGLRDGQWVAGQVRRGGRGQQMHEIQSVNGDNPEDSRKQPAFDELTVINPNEPLRMETVPERYTTRVLDIVAPIGKGQRGLIVAPPRTGKTTLLQHIADAMVKNHPDVKLIMLLVDERPEEVTEIRHTVPTAEIMASSNDMDVRSHTRIAELAIERAKRLVEAGKDVFILLDSITRLGRAFNNALTNGGRTMSGGMDARALEIPRRLFAAARNTEEAGSLTIIATALVETGSRMDELIFQEFKGTGNMELVLDRKVAEQRVYPAVEIFQSGTRREELLVPADLLQRVHFLRRGLAGCRPLDAIERLLFFLKKFPTNEQMLREIRVQ